MAYKLDPLPYDYSALEPHIDTRTMAVHHDKHHQAYVNNLNKALEGYEELQNKNVMAMLANLDAVPDDIRTAVRNHGGGHANHTTFWRSMSSAGGGEPSGKLAEAIDDSFGSFDDFKEAFSKAAVTLFGAGWAWLCADSDGNLLVTTTQNQDNPISEGLIPLLGLDVWEHAYYLKYENRRADYVAAWWNVVSWGFVSGNYTAVRVERGIRGVANWFEDTFFKSDDD
jgi:Fe-Mn family superoxide dismutase